MAITKNETLPNGVPLSYYRIVSLTTVVNQQCTIEVAGYVSQESRDQEQAALAQARETGEYPRSDVFVETQYISVDYDPDMSVTKAYQLLKATEEFEGAEDVWEMWAIGETYYIGDIREYDGQLYRCKQLHTSQSGWEPPNVAALWKVYEESGDGIDVWVQPTGSHDAYMNGAKVHYPTANDPVYISTMDYNTYAPDVYGWELYTS